MVVEDHEHTAVAREVVFGGREQGFAEVLACLEDCRCQLGWGRDCFKIRSRPLANASWGRVEIYALEQVCTNHPEIGAIVADPIEQGDPVDLGQFQAGLNTGSD